MNSPISSISCTNCEKIIMPPVWQCKDNHIFCSGCLESECNICGGSLLFPTRNHSVEDLIKNSEELYCIHHREGCDFIGRFVDLLHHQITCEFSDSPNQCMIKNCGLKFRKQPMIKHLITQHKASEKINNIENGKFHIEIFKQINCEDDWKSFVWKPFVFEREIDEEKRFYLVQVWSEDWVLYAEVFSLTHNHEPIRYLLDLPKGKAGADVKGKYVLVSNTISYKRNAPIFCVPLQYALKNYSYIHTRGDVKAIFLQFQLSSKDFFNF